MTCLIIACLSGSALSADSIFSAYDFTFYETVSQSLAIMDSSTIGFDYTGFGFIGDDNPYGLFMRIGVQMPYSSLANLFTGRRGGSSQTTPSGQDGTQATPDAQPPSTSDGGITTDAPSLPSSDMAATATRSPARAMPSMDMSTDSGNDGTTGIPPMTQIPTQGSEGTGDVTEPAQPSEDLGLVTGTSTDDTLDSEYRLTFILGPAIRHVFNRYFDFYAGIGPKIEEYVTMDSSTVAGGRTTRFDTVLAIDFDFGVKFNLEDNTSCRVGVYSTYELLSYTYTVVDGIDGEKATSTSDIHLNVIASGDSRIPLSAIGYVSMGTTFSSSMKRNVYRYETTSPEVGEGTLTVIGQK